MTLYRVIDKNTGIFLRDDFAFDETEIGLDVEPAQGFYLPKWDGTQWVEGGVKPEPIPQEPTFEDKLIDTIANALGVTL